LPLLSSNPRISILAQEKPQKLTRHHSSYLMTIINGRTIGVGFTT